MPQERKLYQDMKSTEKKRRIPPESKCGPLGPLIFSLNLGDLKTVGILPLGIEAAVSFGLISGNSSRVPSVRCSMVREIIV
jgi:hypothetical protein